MQTEYIKREITKIRIDIGLQGKVKYLSYFTQI